MCKFTRFSPVADVMAAITSVDKPFARKMVAAYAANQRISAAQFEVAVQIANEAQPKTTTLTGKNPVFTMLDEAEVRRARLVVDDMIVVLQRGKKRPSYVVTDRTNNHLGTVTDRETFKVGSAYRLGKPGVSVEALMAALAAFAADPISEMAKYGLRTGVCGMCGRRLDDPESVARGIGPVCLKRLTH